MLAKDVYPSRLERAKRELERAARYGWPAIASGWSRSPARRLTYPPTTDYAAVKLFWRDLDPWDMPVGGTAIGRAITRGARAADARCAAKGGATRGQAILLLTDGEDNDSEPLEAAEEASKLGVKIFTVGIGSRSGELIPEYDEQGKVTGYVKDADGHYVTSRLARTTLVEIAAQDRRRVLPRRRQAVRRRGCRARARRPQAHRRTRRGVVPRVRRDLRAAAAAGVPAAGRRGLHERAPAPQDARRSRA